MTPKEIITAWEVVTYSPAGRDYPTDVVCEKILPEEQDFGYTILGKELYEWLQTKLTTIPEGVVEYDADTTYELDDMVIRHGCMYQSAVDCNRTDPVEPDSEWGLVEKFTDPCANQLWKLYLRAIFAYRIYSSTLNYTTIRAGAGGLTVRASIDGGTPRAATKGELADTKASLQHDIDLFQRNMVRWLRVQQDDETCTLPLSGWGTCGPARPRHGGVRRWGFRH